MRTHRGTSEARQAEACGSAEGGETRARNSGEGAWFGVGLGVSVAGLVGFTLGLLWDWLSGRRMEVGAMGPLQLAAVAGGAVACAIGVVMLLVPRRQAQRRRLEGEEE